MNIPSYYALFYRANENEKWQSTRLDLPFEQWEDYCKEQNYFEYEICDLRKYDSDDLQLLTDVVYYEGRYYLSSEDISYPKTSPKSVKDFAVSMEWLEDENSEYKSKTYEEVYAGDTLWTDIETKFLANPDMEEVGIVAQFFIEDFPNFLETLKQNKHAVYNNLHYSPFKWLCWLNSDKVRIIHQDYRVDCDREIQDGEILYVNEVFDILVDKNLFFDVCENMILKMKEFSQRDLDGYKKYTKEQNQKNLLFLKH